jgi:hypothetical protein
MFRVLAGGTIEPHPVIPPMEESLGVPRAQLSERLDAPPQSGPPLVYRGPDKNPPRIETLKFDAALTQQLVARARSENTTVHGAPCSAVVRAGRMFSKPWRQSQGHAVRGDRFKYRPIELRWALGRSAPSIRLGYVVDDRVRRRADCRRRNPERTVAHDLHQPNVDTIAAPGD